MKLAFVHIEKTAGTSFVHLLRGNYFLKYIDVRPLKKRDSTVFLADDLRKYFAINPLLSVIGGHSVVPYSNLEDEWPDIQYVSLLREPNKRVVSHYLHWVSKKQYRGSFEDFIKIEEMCNFQTKKISLNGRSQDVKNIIDKRFLLVGLVEYFDEFLHVLKHKLANVCEFNVIYKRQNKGVNNMEAADILYKYHDMLREYNCEDWKIYEYVKEIVMPREKLRYHSDLDNSAEGQDVLISPKSRVKLFADYVIRKSYYQPITGLIRLSNGLPYSGSYQYEAGNY